MRGRGRGGAVTVVQVEVGHARKGPPIVDYRKAQNWNPLAPGDIPSDLRSFYQNLTTADGPHGGKFYYVSPNTDLLGWVMERATGRRYADLVSELLWQPMGAERSAYITVDRLGAPRCAGGFCCTARDLARFGLMVLAKGKWADKTILADQPYLKESTSTSQKLNPNYGYLWWINSNANDPKQAPRLGTAPKDMFSANGALNRRCFVVPSLQIVVTRLGDQPGVKNNGFDRQLWKLIMEASPAGE